MRFLRHIEKLKKTKNPQPQQNKKKARYISLDPSLIQNLQRNQEIDLSSEDQLALCELLNKNPNAVVLQGRQKIFGIDEIEKTDTKDQLKFDILRINKNVSYVLVKKLGKGAFGEVYDAPFRIVKQYRVSKITAVKVYPALGGDEGVIKVQKLDEGIEEIKPAMKFQGVRHFEKLNKTYSATVMAKAQGKSLKKINLKTLDFFKQVSIACQIISELASVHSDKRGRYAHIHSDLKPANIMCDISRIATGSRQGQERIVVKIVDWGLCSSAKDAEFKGGTPAYMDPTLLNQVADDNSIKPINDVYSVAGVLWEVFGANDVLSNKRKAMAYGEEAMIKAPFCSEGAFSNIPYDVDELLVEDMKEFIKRMESKTLEFRPAIQNPPGATSANNIDAITFFTNIQTRISLYQSFKEEFNSFNLNFSNFIQLQKQFNQKNKLVRRLLRADKDNKNACSFDWFQKITVPNEKIKSAKNFSDYYQNELHQMMVQLLTDISKISPAKGHAETLRLCTKEKRYADQDPFSSKKIQLLSIKIQGFSEKCKQFNGNMKDLEKKIKNIVDVGTNSSGIEKINKVLQSNKSAVKKLDEIISIAKSRRSGLRDFMSNISVFGSGRQANVNALYDKIKSLSDDYKGSDYLAMQKLSDLSLYISENKFKH